MQQALSGYKVLDFTQHAAGPTAGRVLADLGADVIKLEMMPGGDQSRHIGTFEGNRSAFYVQHNRGKKSLCLNPKSEAGGEIVRALLQQMDVFIESFAPGVIARMGFGYEAVRPLNPRLIMVSISTYGQTGPLSQRPGLDSMGAALSGMSSMQGDPGGPPQKMGAAIGDMSAGMNAAAGIGFALLQRSRTGEGQYLDISLLDAYFHLFDRAVLTYSASRGQLKPTRAGNHTNMDAPSGLFRGKDRYLVIMGGNPEAWAKLCHTIGQPELIEDPRFANAAARVAHLPELSAVLEGWIQAQASDEEAERILEAARILVSPVLSVEEAVHHPQLRQRGTVISVPDPIYGQLELPASPVRLSASPASNLPAPLLGEHNQEILEHYLGYSPERIAELERAGVIHQENR